MSVLLEGGTVGNKNPWLINEEEDDEDKEEL